MSTLWTDASTARLATVLLHFFWQGVLIALGAWAVMALSSRATTRYAAGCVAMVLMLLAPLATFVWLDRSASVASPTSTTVAPIEPLTGPAPLPALTPPSATPTPTTPATPVRFAPWVVWSWAAGVLLLSLRHALGLASLSRLRRRCSPLRDPFLMARCDALRQRMGVWRGVRLLRCDPLDSPAVAGIVRPVILWPGALVSGLTPTQLDALLVHELAHITRHDYLANLLQTLIESLLFYHPCVWWLSRRVRQEREHCCDDRAARAVGDPLAIAQALVALESRRVGLSLALSARGGSLMKRVQRLLRPLPAHPVGGRAAAIVIALAMLAFATAWTARAQEKTSADRSADEAVLLRIEELSLQGEAAREKVAELRRDHSMWSPEMKAAQEAESDAWRQLVEAFLDRFNANEEPPAVTEPMPGMESAYDRLMRETDFVEMLARESRIRFGAEARATARLERLVTAQRSEADAHTKARKIVIEPGTGLDGDSGSVRLRTADVSIEAGLITLEGHSLEAHDGSKVELTAAEPATRPTGDVQLTAADYALGQLRKLERDIREVSLEIARVEAASGKDTPELTRLRDLETSLQSQLSALTSPIGEYYMAPHAARPGVYSLSGRKISLRQAIISAGMFDETVTLEGEDAVVIELVRRVQTGEGVKEVVSTFRWPDIRDNKISPVFLLPDDQVRVRLIQPAGLKEFKSEEVRLLTELARLKSTLGANAPQVRNFEAQLEGLRKAIAGINNDRPTTGPTATGLSQADVQSLSRDVLQRQDPAKREAALARVNLMLEGDPTSQTAGLGVLATASQVKFDRSSFVPAVVRCLRSADSQVRAAALRVLPSLGPVEPAHLALIKSMARDPSPAVRSAVTGAILFATDRKGGADFEEVVSTLLADQDSSVRREALRVVWGVPLSETVEEQILEVSHQPGMAHDAAYFALSTRPLIRLPVARRLVELLDDPDQYNTGARVAWGCRNPSTPEAWAVLEPALLAALKDSTVAYMREQCAAALSRSTNPQVMAELKQLSEEAQ